MKLLLGDEFAPITSEYGFVEATAHAVAEWYSAWDGSNVAARRVRIEQRSVSGQLRDLLHLLLPLTSVEPRRFLFVQCRGWTAYFTNAIQGSDASVLAHVAEQLRCRAVRVVAQPDSLGRSTSKDVRGRYGAMIFELYGPRRTEWLNYERTVATVNDGGDWTFTQSGQPLPCEDVARYKRAPVRERLRTDDIERCLSSLGINGFDAEAFGPDGFLLERHGPTAPNLREFTLDEIRYQLGIAG